MVASSSSVVRLLLTTTAAASVIVLRTPASDAFRPTSYARYRRRTPSSTNSIFAAVADTTHGHGHRRRACSIGHVGRGELLKRRATALSSPSAAYDANGNANASSSTSSVANVNEDLTVRTELNRVNGDSGAPPSSAASIPTYRELLSFLATTVLIWLSEPLLSLVDTTVVGFTSRNSVVQLAALGPATTLHDSILYTAYFLAIATTNKLAPAFAMKRYRKLQQTTSHLLGVATLMGFATTAVCYGAGHFFLRHMVAAGPTSGELVHFATRYVWIRASVAVASVLGMVMQAFCLATLDTKTPALAVAAAFTVNVAGDLLLRKWGIQGAAAATALSGLLATSILFRAVRRRLREWRELELQESKHAHDSMERSIKHLFVPLSNETAPILSSNSSEHSDSHHESLASDDVGFHRPPTTQWRPPSKIPFASLPDRKSALDLVKIAGPIFFVILAKSACYSAMTVKCADFGVLSLATHCILMRVFFFYVTFGDAVSQAAQSYLPATLYPKVNMKSFQALLKRLLMVGSLLSVVNSNGAMIILRRFGRFLSSDGSIIRLMSEQSTFLAMAVLLHPFITLFEGTVVASRDFRTLVATYAVTLGLHFSILNFACDSFPAIWRTFFLFQSIRLGNFAIQVWRKQSTIRRRESAVS